jgi:hypothetical protein
MWRESGMVTMERVKEYDTKWFERGDGKGVE